MNPSLPRYPIAGFQWIYFARRKSAQINIGEFRLGSLCERFWSKRKRLSSLWYSCRGLDARSLLWLCNRRFRYFVHHCIYVRLLLGWIFIVERLIVHIISFYQVADIWVLLR